MLVTPTPTQPSRKAHWVVAVDCPGVPALPCVADSRRWIVDDLSAARWDADRLARTANPAAKREKANGVNVRAHCRDTADLINCPVWFVSRRIVPVAVSPTFDSYDQDPSFRPLQSHFFTFSGNKEKELFRKLLLC